MDLMTWIFRIMYGGVGITGLGLSLMYIFQGKLVRDREHCVTLCCTAAVKTPLMTCICAAQLYMPRIPGVSNDVVYLPDSFGFSYEVSPLLAV